MPIVECALEGCKNTVYAKPYQLKKRNCYCSMECSWKGRDRNSVRLKCLFCGVDFIGKKYSMVNGNGLCCSQKCGKRYHADTTKQDPEERFWSKVKILSEDECWEFQGCKNQDGYGIFNIDRHHLRSGGAHRASWIFANKQEIPKGMKILHSCDNPPCCNPKHLRLGTQQENIEDMLLRKRHRCPEGVKHAHAKLTNEIVLAIRAEYTGKKGEQTWIGNKYGITSANVKAIVERRTWKHV